MPSVETVILLFSSAAALGGGWVLLCCLSNRRAELVKAFNVQQEIEMREYEMRKQLEQAEARRKSAAADNPIPAPSKKHSGDGQPNPV